MATMEEAEELDNKRQQLHEAFLAKRGHAIKELKKFVRLHYCPALPLDLLMDNSGRTLLRSNN